LFPAVFVAGWWWLRGRQLSVWQLSLAGSLAVTVVVLSDIGTGANQLLDPTLLTVLLVGELAGRLRAHAVLGEVGIAVLAVAVGWVVAAGLVVTLAPAMVDAAAPAGPPGRDRDREHRDPVGGPVRARVAESGSRGPGPVHVPAHRTP
jgi:hypothetical protein